ncbi:D-tyrosyl-tRNA(Tyr) deacylase [bacterium]|nr:D-tyrosyl-tRNA(Tyr) deacylase [bacterium]MBU1638516.1 D-tyrosyl-tRNA(Tyr) deacylase [bacterium]
MRLVLQRVSAASVAVDGEVVGKIGSGLLILLGIEAGDKHEALEWAARKTAELRIFEDDERHMNRSLLEVGGEALVVSQFTLCADIQKGRRPSFVRAAQPEVAEPLCEEFISMLREMGIHTEQGKFGGKMSVSLVNEGPVTIIVDK